MNIRDLIAELESIADEHGDEVEVRLAQQPRWAFEYSIQNVVAVDLNDDPEDDQCSGEGEPNVIAYIGEGQQLGYLPGLVTDAVWN